MKKIRMQKMEEIIRLRYDSKLSYRSIASHCNCSLGTVSNVLLKASRLSKIYASDSPTSKELALLLYTEGHAGQRDFFESCCANEACNGVQDGNVEKKKQSMKISGAENRGAYFFMNMLEDILKDARFNNESIGENLAAVLQEICEDRKEALKNEDADNLNIIYGYEEDGIILINYNDIYYIDIINRKVNIHTKNNIYFGKKPLEFYEGRLKGKSFFRCHRCYIVNLEKIHKLSQGIDYSYDIYFRDIKDKVPLSRSKQKELKCRFELPLK